MTPAGWYPVALADDIEPGTAAGTRLAGRELVVWRDEAGEAHAWEDRCPHRGMRLSFGFVRGGRLACLYHGWQFDGAGRCRFIPAHPQLDVPASITADRFASAERLGIVWVLAGDASTGAAPPGGNVATVPVRSLSITAPSEQTFAALAVASPFGGREDGCERDGSLVTFRAGPDALYAAVQPITPGETVLHLALAGTGEAAQRRCLSLWAEALRRALEAQAAPMGAVA